MARLHGIPCASGYGRKNFNFGATIHASSNLSKKDWIIKGYMIRLENIKPGALIEGLDKRPVTVTGVEWYGSNAVELFWKTDSGRTDSELLFRDAEARLELLAPGKSPSFDGDGALFRLASEAYRIRLAFLFDPHLAVHTSQIEPLPHQITAVYGDLLPRQPLRFLLADDPGAGKTIQTGLYLKELQMRGDLKRCLIVCPGSLAEQWQDELWSRFGLEFDILSREKIESSRSGNPFSDHTFLIARLDQLSRSDELQELLTRCDWDVIVVDEAHKMSASFYGGEMKATKRYRLGELLGRVCRHFLLLTATPHNGKEEDFQFFMALLDPDRFEGRFRSGVHTQDVSDLMRRRVKEELFRFDGKRLFPERRAYTVNYSLSPAEAALYEAVTSYVREEMNRADKLSKEGEGRRGATVGFALTILQRRLASSPEAIYQSLSRRRKRLESRLNEEKLQKRGSQALLAMDDSPSVEVDEGDEFYDETPGSEVEDAEEAIVDRATAARTLAELQAEIRSLQKLEALALGVRNSRADRKWDELSNLLQGEGHETARELFDETGQRRKLILFTEHRDTLNALAERIRTLLGRDEAVVTIHGGVSREDRRRVQEQFTQDKDVLVLVATDAAGEGINLQRAHLMVNYDLPWNPNRIEQRFGRIHRIGQAEVCHLWNLVAVETREGQVWKTLLDKLENQRAALGGGVFDVLGQCFEGNSLRQLLLDAVRYGDQPEVRARLLETLENALDTQHLKSLLEERALARETLSLGQVQLIREDMERAEARKLQPHFIAQFFLAAFQKLGGDLKKREPGRFEITRVPHALRERNRHILNRYERVTFQKEDVQSPGKPTAALLCPGHPLLDAVVDLVLERYRDVLKRGATLIDPENRSVGARALWMLEHSLHDGRIGKDGERQIVSRRLQFVETNAEGHLRDGGYAPYLDYRPASDAEKNSIASVLESGWLSGNLEAQVLEYAVSHLVPPHFEEVRNEREARIDKTRAAVKERLTKEISYWDSRALDLQTQEEAGKANARLNSEQASRRADDLEARLQSRLDSLEKERRISGRSPLVLGVALVVPLSLIPPEAREPDDSVPSSEGKYLPSKPKPPEPEPPLEAELKKRLDQLAVQTVLATERAFGHEPTEMDHNHPGYDIESKNKDTGALRFLEVKGKLAEYGTVTVSKTQILTALTVPEDWYLVVVPITRDGEGIDCELEPGEPFYLQRPFTSQPDFAATSVNFDLHTLLGGNTEGSNIL